MRSNLPRLQSRASISRAACAKTKVPLIVGSAGQAGGDLNVDWTVDIVQEIARDHGYRPKIAVLYSEQSAAIIKAKNAEGKVRPLPPLGPLADETIDECRHIVALMGPSPMSRRSKAAPISSSVAEAPIPLCWRRFRCGRDLRSAVLARGQDRRMR
jgi:hypothetical protein